MTMHLSTPAFFNYVKSAMDSHDIVPQISDAGIRKCLNDDLAHGLEGLRNDLKAVFYHPKLGNYHQKGIRVAHLAGLLAPQFEADKDHAERVALLADIDLFSRLVEEVPQIRGLASALYAQKMEEPEAVWRALFDLYEDRQGHILTDNLAICVRVAECLDTLVAFEVIREKDEVYDDESIPMRSASLLVNMLLETNTHVEILKKVSLAAKDIPGGPGVGETTSGLLLDHLMLEQRDFHGVGDTPLDILSEKALDVTQNVFKHVTHKLYQVLAPEGVTTAHIDAITATGSSDLVKISFRARILRDFLTQPEGQIVLKLYNRGVALSKIPETVSVHDINMELEEKTQHIWRTLNEHGFETALAEVHDLIQLVVDYLPDDDAAQVENLSHIANPISLKLRAALRPLADWEELSLE